MVVAWLAVAVGPASAGDKSDVVVLRNGDEVHGDIEGLSYGVLELETDSMGTVEVRWEDVASMASRYTFQVEDRAGGLYLGTFRSSPAVGLLVVEQRSGEVELILADVVLIRPIAEGFLKRLDGYLNLGFSFTKASDVAQLNFASEVIYKEEDYRLQLDLNAILTSQSDEPTAKRSEALLTYARFLDERYFAVGTGGFQQNGELGLELRTLLAGGLGRDIALGAHTSAYLIAGLALNHEQPTGDAPDATNLEGLLRGEFRLFYLRSPKLSLDAVLTVFPGITDAGRVRTNLDVTLRKELIKDFTWDLHVYANHDNRPANPTASQSDYGIVTGLGYSF